MLTNLKTLLAAGAVAAALAANANAAGYIKYDGVDGEAKAACAEQPQTQTTNNRRAAKRAARLQSGFVYHYAFAMLIGVVVLITWYLLSMA